MYQVNSLFYVFKSIFILKAGDTSLKDKLSTGISCGVFKKPRVGTKSVGREVGLLGLVLGTLSRLMRPGPFSLSRSQLNPSLQNGT